MEHLYSNKHIKHDAKNGTQRLEIVTGNLSLKPLVKKNSFFSSNQETFYSENLKKKRWFGSPIPDKRDHTLTLSESFVNLIMIHGKKRKAEKIFSQTLKNLAKYLQSDVERENHKKKETALFYREEKDPVLLLSDKIENRSVHYLLQKAIDNVKPTLQVRKVRIARSIYQVPFIMKRKRQEKNAIRWIVESAKKKSRHSGATFSECLAQAVLEAFLAQGQAREKRDQLHRTAEANRAYLRYRWW